MTPSAPTLAGQAARRATAITFGALLLAGVGTALALHLEATRSLDQVLLVAAREGAHPPAWRAEHDPSPVTVRVEPGDSGSEQPRFYTTGDVRGVELPVETEDEQHVRVYAEAPAVTLAETALPFALRFGVVGVLVSGLAGLAQARAMTQALRPLAHAAREASQISALGSGTRLSEDAPAEVSSLLRAFNALLGRLEASFATQTRFTDQAAHELRTPVAGLRGAIEVALRRTRTPEEYRAVLASTLEQADRLTALVDGLLTLARVDAGQAEQGREGEHAAMLAHAAAAQEKQALDEAGCAFSMSVADDPEVEVHVPLVTAAVSTLLRNAARHAPGSTVTLRVERRGDRVAFVVDDNGPGVPAARREEAFSRLARGAAARTGLGLGLGLPLARAIARRHGGDCWLEDSPSGGCRALLTLPLPQDPADLVR